MPICQDPLVSRLQSLGFNALRLPRHDYVPSLILAKTLWQPPVPIGPLAEAFEHVTAPDLNVSTSGHLSGASSARYRKALGLKLVAGWLTAPEQLNAALSGTSRMSIQFGEMRLLTCSLETLGQLLLEGEPGAVVSGLTHHRLFIVAEALQTKEFTLAAENDSAQAAALSATAITPSALSVDMTIDATSANAGLLRFKAKTFHTIGFKAYEIEVSSGEFRLVPKATGSLSHMTEPVEQHAPIIFDDENIL